MDPENTQAQAGVTPPAPVTQSVVQTPVSTPPMPEVQSPPVPVPNVPVQGQPTVPVESPKGGGSLVMKIAIWVLVFALVVAIAYAAYTYYISQNQSPVNQIQVPGGVTPNPTTIVNPQSLIPTQATASSSPTALPVGSQTPLPATLPTTSPSAAPMY